MRPATISLMVLMFVVLAATAAAQTPETLFDFEKEPAGIRALSSEYTLVKAPHGEGRHLRWEIKPNQIVYQLRLPLEKDLTAYSWLVFRLRGEGHTPPGVVTIWFRCKQGWFTYPLPAPTTEWKTHRIPLIAFEATSTAKRNAVRSITLRGYLSSERLVVELDDISVVPDAGGWEAGLPPRLTFEEFIATDTLAFTSTTKESGKPARLYRQAGAFFAFLKDGPVKARYPELLELFVKVNTDKRSRVKMMEKLYEKPIAELQKQWVAWGTDKASRKREP
jgi:hypothetical protein